MPDSARSDADEIRAWAAVGQRGFCVHSFFAPSRGQNCAGCLVRESMRALGMLLDAVEHGPQDPMHGLVGIKTQEDAVRCARAIYEMVEEVRRG